MKKATLKRTTGSVLAAFMLAGVLTGCGGGQAGGDLQTLTLTIGHNNTGTTVTSFIADEFKRLLEEKSDGKIKVEVYPGGQIGSDREMLDSVRAGDLNFVVQGTGSQVSNVPDAGVFDMPFMFDTADEARKAVDDPEFRELLNKSYSDAGLDLTLLSDQGFRELSTNKKIDSFESFKGMNLRTQENPVHVSFWKAMGVNATPMAQAEVFLSLQQGLLDGQENPYITIDNFKLQEVQEYLVDTHHIFHLVTVVGNRDFIASLPQEYQDMIRETADEVLVSSRKMSDESVEEYRQKLIADGMTYIEVDDIPGMRDQMKEATKDTDQLIRETVNGDLVDAYFKAAGLN